MVGRLRWLMALLGSALAIGVLAGTASAQGLRVPAPEPMPSVIGGTVSLVEEPCPFAGCGLQATVIARHEGRIVARTESDQRGRYRLSLRPGTYELLAWPRIRHVYCPVAVVYVPWGKQRVDFRCRWFPSTTDAYLRAAR